MGKLILNFLINLIIDFITNALVWFIVLIISVLSIITNGSMLNTLCFMISFSGFIFTLAVGQEMAKKFKKKLNV